MNNNEKRPILICNDGFRQYPIVPECTEFARRHKDGTEETIGFFLPKEDLDEYVAEAEKLIDELYDKIDELKREKENTAMDNENLKPCPFCGGEAKVLGTKYEDGEYYIVCEKCRVRMGSYSNPEDAIAAWNKRNYPEKQDSPNELMDFVKFCQNASEGCIVYINNRARDLIAKHKECCKYAECKDGREINFPTIPKLSYTDVEKMVKPLEWKLDCNFGGDSLAEFNNAFFRISFWGEAKYIVFYDTRIIEGGFACLDDAKQAAQEFLVNLVAAALGVERSGE